MFGHYLVLGAWNLVIHTKHPYHVPVFKIKKRIY
jgi:hypothetical protein